MRPLKDRVLVKKIEPENVTVSGIILTAKVEEKYQRGEIIAVGHVMGELPEVKIGDKVIFSLHAGSEIEIEGITHLLMRSSEIMAIID